MKSFNLSILTLAFFLFVSVQSQATVWTVSNVTSRPAQFTQLQAAIDSALINDTILMTGGGALYSTATLRKPMVIIGEGIGPQTTPARISQLNLYRLNSSLAADGSKIYGLRINNLYIDGNFTGASVGQETINNIIIERCQIETTRYQSSDGGFNNLTFRNCLFKDIDGSGQTRAEFFEVSEFSAVLYTNCVFSNSIFWTWYVWVSVNSGIIIRNCLFMNTTTSIFQGGSGRTIQQLIVENSIFYKAEPTGTNNSTFNNNITYLNNSNTIPYGSNLGSGNIINIDPKFSNYPQLGAGHAWSYNFNLLAGSPAIGTGTNGTDIGLTGGNAPINSNLHQVPKIPVVTEVNIPVSSVPVGGTLQINIKANTRN